MTKQEFEKAVKMLRSNDSMTYEEGYHWLLGSVDEYCDELISLMTAEQEPDMRGKFIELLGDCTDEKVVSILEAELSSPYRDVRFWAHSQLEYSEYPKAQEIAKQYREKHPDEDWY